MPPFTKRRHIKYLIRFKYLTMTFGFNLGLFNPSWNHRLLKNTVKKVRILERIRLIYPNFSIRFVKSS